MRDSNQIAHVVMWPSLVTLAFLWEKLPQPQLYKDLTIKTTFLRSGLGSSSMIWDWNKVWP